MTSNNHSLEKTSQNEGFNIVEPKALLVLHQATDEQIEAAAGNLAGGADRYFKDIGASAAPSVCSDHSC